MNRLTVSLHTLHERGRPARRIARELGVHRKTVGEEIKRAKPAKVTTGSGGEESSEPAKVTAGSERRGRSQCEGWRGTIEESCTAGLSAQRIYQDLKSDHDYTGGHESVKTVCSYPSVDYAVAVSTNRDSSWRRMQVDFGQGAAVIEEGERRRPHVFQVTLSFSAGVTRILSENGVWVMTGSSPVCLTAMLPNPYRIEDAEGRGIESIEEAEILGWAAQIKGPWCIEWMGTVGRIQRKHWSKPE